MSEQHLKHIAVAMLKMAHDDAPDDALGVSELFPELTDEEVRAVTDLMREAKIEVSW